MLLLNFDYDVLEVRKQLIEKLEEKDEVEQVFQVYVNKSDAFIDENNLKWHTVDVRFNSKHSSEKWKKVFFRRNIFQKYWF